jgi:hypothetical protein
MNKYLKWCLIIGGAALVYKYFSKKKSTQKQPLSMQDSINKSDAAKISDAAKAGLGAVGASASNKFIMPLHW